MANVSRILTDHDEDELLDALNGSRFGFGARIAAAVAAIIKRHRSVAATNALREAAKEARERGDIGRDGCIEVWDWLTIRANQIEEADR